MQREPYDETLVPEEPRLLARSIRMLVENNILDRDMLRHVLGVPVSITEELCGLPAGYFEQDDTHKVIELRLRSGESQRGVQKRRSGSGQVVQLGHCS